MNKDKNYLRGYTYKFEEGKKARNEGKLLTLRLETSLSCNMKCRYCAWDSGKPLDYEIEFNDLIRCINDGIELGIKSVVIIGGGEPTIYHYFRELISYINDNGLIPVVITNGLTMSSELAQFLFDNNTSVLLKYDSLREDVQDYLSGMSGAYAKIQAGLKNLLAAGYTSNQEDGLRLGLSFVATKQNIGEVTTIWKFCRENNIYPNMELLNPIGRTKDNAANLIPNQQDIKKVINEIKEIDASFGIESSNEPPCLQHLYSMYLNVQGYIQPCGAIRIKKFKYDDYPTLKECYDNSYFSRIRTIESHLDEKSEVTYFSV